MRALVIMLAFLSACASGPSHEAAKATPAKSAGLRIKLTTIYVDDQEKALRFYTEVLGLTKKADFSNGPFRWLTVGSPADPNGTELQLALNADPAAKAYQQALFQQSQPAVMLFCDDVTAEHARLVERGAEFTAPPSEVMPGVMIATLKDGCGNLIQLSQVPSY